MTKTSPKPKTRQVAPPRLKISQPEMRKTLLVVFHLLAADGLQLGEHRVDVEILALLFRRLEFRFLAGGLGRRQQGCATLGGVDRPYHPGAEAARRTKHDSQFWFRVWFGGHGSDLGTESPLGRRQGAVVRNTTWDCFWALSRYFSKPLRRRPRWAYIGQFPSSPMTTGFASKTGGRSTKEICHEQRTADAEGDCRVAR